MIGGRARKGIAQRGHIKRVHKVAAMGGMALAGSTIGALVSIPLIEGEGEGTFLGSDEKTFTILVLGGTALGSLFAWMNRDELPSLSLQVAPALVGEGRYGFQISVSY
jgi:hypothetical protein